MISSWFTPGSLAADQQHVGHIVGVLAEEDGGCINISIDVVGEIDKFARRVRDG